MRIALIFPPYTHKIFSENLKTVDEEFCVGPPIILAYVAAILEQCGHKVMLLDIRVLKLSKKEALEKLTSFRPDIIGFRAEAYYFHDALDWVSFLKNNLKIPVFAGGPNLSMYPKETMRHSEIDYGIIGESIEILPRFIRALENNEKLDGFAGVIYKENGSIVINPPIQKYADLNTYPFPARHLLPNEKYYSFLSQRKNFTIMITSTGCPFNCNFCAIHPNNKYRERSPKNIVDEIEICCKEFSIKEIDFFDAVLFFNKLRIMEVFNEIRKRGLEIEWSCRSRVDVVDKEMLKEASRAGCRKIYYGIESADSSVLRAINKEVSIEQVEQAIKWSRDFGIKTMAFFMVGNPQDTVDKIKRSIKFAKKLDLDFVQVCRTIAKPGTELDRMIIEKTGRDYWREHIEGSGLKEKIPSLWVGLTQKQLKDWTRRFYLSFYLRPKIILNRISGLKSISELIRYIRAAVKMLMR